MKTFKLHGGYSVLNASLDKEPAAAEVWSLCNNPVHSFFGHATCKINDHEISDSTTNPYPWKAYFEVLLVHAQWYQDMIMSVDNWHKDDGQTASLTAADAGYNKGYKARREGLMTGGRKGK